LTFDFSLHFGRSPSGRAFRYIFLKNCHCENFAKSLWQSTHFKRLPRRYHSS